MPTEDTVKAFVDLCRTVEALRGPDGCPWDKEQNHASLAPFALEEAFELVEAIELGRLPEMKEELGDYLFQVLLHAEIARQSGEFTLKDVCEALNQKMIRRHPHVFADQKVADSQEVLANWTQLKQQEKLAKQQGQANGSESSKLKPQLFDIPVQLPGLARAEKIGYKSREVRFDWNTVSEVLHKVREEFEELVEAIDRGDSKAQSHELGDLLFSLAQLGRHLGVGAEAAVREANRRFERRYFAMLAEAEKLGVEFAPLPAEEKERLWEKVKARLESH